MGCIPNLEAQFFWNKTTKFVVLYLNRKKQKRFLSNHQLNPEILVNLELNTARAQS